MTGHGEKLSRRAEYAIVALLTLPTITEAAQTIGVAESTLLRWLRQAEFRNRYRAARQEAVGVAVARVQQSSAEAVETLRAIMQDKALPAAARVSAAKTLLELAIKAGELGDLAQRVELLETRQSG